MCKGRQNRKNFFRGSEDFGHFTKLIPGALWYISFGEEDDPEAVNVHTGKFDFNDDFIEMVCNIDCELIRM